MSIDFSKYIKRDDETDLTYRARLLKTITELSNEKADIEIELHTTKAKHKGLEDMFLELQSKSQEIKTASMGADTIELSILNKQLRDTDNRLRSLHDCILQLTSSKGVKEVISKALSIYSKTFHTQHATVYLCMSNCATCPDLCMGEKMDGNMHTQIENLHLTDNPQIPLHEMPNIVERIRLNNVNMDRSAVLNDMEVDDLSAHGTKSALLGLLKFRERIKGIVVLESNDYGFRDDKKNFFQMITDIVAISLDNSYLEARLRDAALRDELTDVHSLRALTEVKKTHWAHKPSSTFVFADIDKFKNVNDTHGHKSGDDVLKHFAKQLREGFKGKGDVFRYGGEEFLIVSGYPVEEVLDVLEKARANIKAHEFFFTTGKQKITASFGVYTSENGEDYDKAIEKADWNMYEAKNTGRDKVVVNQNPTPNPTTNTPIEG